MLYLSRKVGESIVINNSIELTIVEVRGKSVKIGFDFPPEATILRKEIYDRIMEENMAASGTQEDLALLEEVFDLPRVDVPTTREPD